VELDDIIEGCKNGNTKCQTSLVQTFATRLMALCMRYTKDEDLAKDALQETFICAFKYINTYQNKGSFEGWLRRIAVNSSLKMIKTMHARYFSDESAIDVNMHAQIPDVYGKMQKEEVMSLLKNLPHSQYVIFNMNIIEGFDHGEIAEMLNITESTSRATLCKARARLIELMKKQENYADEYLKINHY
jgi:RNA polymerase sigma factor (sigma-70 family)